MSAAVVGLSILAGVTAGCQPPKCRQMSRCCDAIKDHPGVGKACGAPAQGIDDPDTCQTVLVAVEAMFQKRGEPLPSACQVGE